MARLANPDVVITGATSGIGRATALARRAIERYGRINAWTNNARSRCSRASSRHRPRPTCA